jgi:HAE1 family hydrophobic/amphiphilic exporter-1
LICSAVQNTKLATVLEAAMEGAKYVSPYFDDLPFAFIAGLIPLVFASGPGKIGNSTNGSATWVEC